MDKIYEILIADDDAKAVGSCLGAALRNHPSARFTFASSTDECRKLVAIKKFDLVFLDIHFGPNQEKGTDLLPDILEANPGVKVYVMSSDDGADVLVNCQILGAVDFISKNTFDLDAMIQVIFEYIESSRSNENQFEEGQKIADAMGVVFKSQKMLKVFAQVALAKKDPSAHVLVYGETGVGKEAIARAINFNTQRKLVAVDCGAISESLAESEFFGHKRGAFTGATTDKLGRFQQANRGDLFLDELGNLKPAIQIQLLRAIQTQEINPVGSTSPVKVQVRIIAATNADLSELSSQDEFRDDLYQRIKGINITIPPLRERPEDVEVLVKHFIKNSNKPNLIMPQSFLNIFESYGWPGNVRELENTVKFMIAKCGNEPLGFSHLPEEMKTALKKSLTSNSRDVDGAELEEIPLDGSLDNALDMFLKKYLTRRFEKLGSDVSKRKYARELGISRSAVDRFEKKYNIGLSAIG